MRIPVFAAAVAVAALLAAGCGSTTARSHPAKPSAKASASASATATHHHARRHHARHEKVLPSKPARTVGAPVRTGCYPMSDGGTCYEPGEFCRHADAGVHGVAGDGKAIVCENKGGLRWEPV